MSIQTLIELNPQLKEYVCMMPLRLQTRYFIKVYKPNTIIHHRDTEINAFGIVVTGTHRVTSEFENGNIFVIEKNEAISFIGEVTLLSQHTKTSVTLKAITQCTVMYFSRADFYEWIGSDINILLKITQSIAQKLYRVSYNRGERSFYSGKYILFKYIVEKAETLNIANSDYIKIDKTRQEFSEELGISIKTLNRNIFALKKNDAINIIKGKLILTASQYKQKAAFFALYMKLPKNGAFC